MSSAAEPRPPAAPGCSRPRSVPRCWRGKSPPAAARPAAGYGRSAKVRMRARHHRATSQVVPSLESFSTTPMRGELVADAVGFLEVLGLARGVAGRDPAFDLLGAEAPAPARVLRLPCRQAHRGGSRRTPSVPASALRPGGVLQAVHLGDRLRRVEIVEQARRARPAPDADRLRPRPHRRNSPAPSRPPPAPSPSS